MAYGKELILDIHECDVSLFTRKKIYSFMVGLCNLIDMERCDLHFWDDSHLPDHLQETSPQTKGISAIQFIITSNITIHTLELLGHVYINIFSCKDFYVQRAAIYCEAFWEGKIVRSNEIERL